MARAGTVPAISVISANSSVAGNSAVSAVSAWSDATSTLSEIESRGAPF